MEEVVEYLKSFDWDIEKAYTAECPYRYQTLRDALSAQGREAQFFLEERTGKTWAALKKAAKKMKWGEKMEVVDFVTSTELD